MKGNVVIIGFGVLLILMFLPVVYAVAIDDKDAMNESGQKATSTANAGNEPTSIAMDIKGMKDDAVIAEATAVIKGTQEGSQINGEVKLREVKGGVEVMAEVTNVPNPGKHGFHVHEKGSCDDIGKAAGGHFNPKGVAHGLLSKDGSEHAHAGDMGNITIDEKGAGMLSEFLAGASLTSGEDNISGKAIILHEKEDDFSQPTGNAGARIGCGIIELKPKQ